MQSHDERDMDGLAAKRERDAATAVVKEFSQEEITGRYEGEELDKRRRERRALDPDESVDRLEKKHDELKRDVEKKHEEMRREVKDVRKDVKDLSQQLGTVKTEMATAMGDVKVEVATAVGDVRADMYAMGGKLDGQLPMLSEMLSIVKKSAVNHVEREQATALAEIEVDHAKRLAKVALSRERDLDKIDKKQKRRELGLKAMGLVGTLVALAELLHQIGVF